MLVARIYVLNCSRAILQPDYPCYGGAERYVQSEAFNVHSAASNAQQLRNAMPKQTQYTTKRMRSRQAREDSTRQPIQMDR